ncbi:ABC transporter substrate-binding protein [Pseudozobellia thermophila]|uniref:Carbohydrate ABC transporter substrate-binding protein, CUT1 family n=1 Tax=Pseudozobellia thermophila TaxID=192903 RepID=A0A1M6GEN0_9FLAO|nr:extracellular solute-binding protein [Pseudozobellia thermophila]SHJ08331.1 carbohydrate ABC transporter substrate-binding protein, CUT1 family [Pseudozobellia thermophila]
MGTTPSIRLKGMAWDHPRGYEPLRATSTAFSKIRPEVTIQWDIRSLKEFGDMPIENLIGAYDIITIDHPYMGQAHADKLLVPLEGLISKKSMDCLRGRSVGPSFASYAYEGHQYALPVDAAALVAAYRNDLIHHLKLELPKTRAELFDFYGQVPHGHKVAWPLCATDLWCTFLTLCAQDAGRAFIKDKSIEEKVGVRVLDELKRHMDFLHPMSINWNPIQILDRMGDGDEIIYSPFLFGYTNYSRTGYTKNRVDFTNSPTNPRTDVSTLLGGVGLAISVHCEHCDLAAAYIGYVASPEVQEGIYTENGGQPANLDAWQSRANNRLCNGFFDHTLETLEKAYVRPRHRGWNRFQEEGAHILHQGLRYDTPSEEMMRKLNQLYESIA